VRCRVRLCAWLCASTLVAAQRIDIGPAPGRLVDIGGRRIHMICSGSGGPTVVIEAGASAFAVDFALIQPDVKSWSSTEKPIAPCRPR
jgi:hypothetical protein